MNKIVLLILLFTGCGSTGYEVVGVTDGDTIKLLIDNKEVKVRLEGIDCPEKKQAFGTKSKQALSDLVFGKKVQLEDHGKDFFGRTLGTIYVDGVNVNAKMIQDGWAWHYKQYNKDKSLADLEQEARSGKRGLWKDKNPIPPWEFRKKKTKL